MVIGRPPRQSMVMGRIFDSSSALRPSRMLCEIQHPQEIIQQIVPHEPAPRAPQQGVSFHTHMSRLRLW